MAKKSKGQDIQQAVAKAKQHYQKGEIKQTLKILEPYQDNEKVQSIIAGIKRRTQEVQKVKNKKRSSNILTYAIVTFVIVFIVALLIDTEQSPTPSPQNETNNESLPTASPTMVIYYAKHDNARLRICERLECAVLEILEFGETIQVINTVTGDAMGGITTWYEAKRGGYIHALDVLDSPSSTPPPVAPNLAPQIQSGGSSSSSSSNSGGSSGFTCPSNCDGARAMGLSAQQAASCPGLDRDHDGVACYGD